MIIEKYCDNGNENVNVSSTVYEVIRTILFFFTRKFYEHKKHETSNKQLLYRRTL